VLDDYIEAISSLLADAENVLALTHVNPDGDAIGSLTAVGVALKQLGKRITLVCDDGFPARSKFLPLADEIQKHTDAAAEYDLLLALDCGDTSRMGDAFAGLQERTPPIINVDHHVTNTGFGQVNVVDQASNSTTEILYQLLPPLGVQMSATLATCLLTGIVTDTLGFRTVGVTAQTFRAASALMEAGADLAMITTRALLIKPMSILRLWQIGLDNMKLEAEGLLWTSISDEARQSVGHAGASSGGLANLLANVDEAAMSAVLVEDGAKVYVGFRCRPPFNVAELALNLGGGGHPLAAGCTLDGPLREAEALVVSMARETIRQQRYMLQPES
jgi:phosphoesterase RecJ-like protein